MIDGAIKKYDGKRDFFQAIGHLFFSMKRIGRIEHVALYMFFAVSLYFLFDLYDTSFGSIEKILFISLLLIIFAYFFLIKIRRLHDFDYSGFWILLFAIPVIGTVWFFLVFLIPGTPSKNKYGETPGSLGIFDYSILFLLAISIITYLLI